MKTTRTALLVIALVATPALALDGEASLLLGQRSLDESLLGVSEVDDQSLLGVSVTLDVGWPVDLAFGLISSSEGASNAVPGIFPLTISTDVDTLELDLGVRRFWGEDELRWFTGGGLAFVTLDGTQVERGDFGPGTEFESSILDDSGSAIGLWVDGGLSYELPRQVTLGLALRYTAAEVDVNPQTTSGSVSLDTSGVQMAATVGYRW